MNKAFFILSLVLFAGCTAQSIDSFEECVNAGNPVMESYPRQCSANGNIFVEELVDESVIGEDLVENESVIEEMITYIDISVSEAYDLIMNDSSVIIIDVSPAYANGHLPGAINYYLGDGSLDAAIPSLDKNATYLVYCHVDSVAILGAQKLVDAGFTKVYRLEGNYAAWVSAGYPVET